MNLCKIFGLWQHVQEPDRSPLTASDHYYGSFSVKGMNPNAAPTNVTSQQDFRSVNNNDNNNDILRTVNVQSQWDCALLTEGGFFYSEHRATGASGTLNKFELITSLDDSALFSSSLKSSKTPDEIVSYINYNFKEEIDDLAPLHPKRLKNNNNPTLIFPRP